MEQLPLIKLEIEGMKHQIIHHFMSYQTELSDYVKTAIEDTINNFDYVSAVKQAAGEIIEGTINNYFKYGDGRKMIEDSLQKGLDEAFSRSEP